LRRRQFLLLQEAEAKPQDLVVKKFLFNFFDANSVPFPPLMVPCVIWPWLYEGVLFYNNESLITPGGVFMLGGNSFWVFCKW